MTRVALAQIDPCLGDREHNLGLIERSPDQATESRAELVVFPECAVTGYVYESLDEARGVAEPVPGRLTSRLVEGVSSHNLYAVVGMLESDGPRVFNSAVVVGPNGIEGVYRKSHVLCLGVDRFATPGDIPYRVLRLPFGRLGVLICYDLRFPEAARCLALAGAQLIALPTNWPDTSSIQPDVFTRARAAENRVYILAANRAGCEREVRFLGRSQVLAPDGNVVAEASDGEEDMLVVDIDVAEADRKHVVLRPGSHEMDCMADRRPDLYGGLLGAKEATSAL